MFPVGKNPCVVCATPEAKYAGDRFKCDGCGIDCRLGYLLRYLKRVKKAVTFDRATELYERARPVIPFGHWLMTRNLELIAKP